MTKAIALLLDGMGIPNWREDPNFRDTPGRVAKMFEEMLTPEKNTWTAFPAKSADLIIVRGHGVIALCPHHLQPVEITAYVGYIPNKMTVGISKLARVVEEQLTVPMMQEDLASRVADAVEAKLEPKGTGVVLSGIHGCMKFRGVESESDTVVSVMRGVLLLNPTARTEFLQLIGRP